MININWFEKLKGYYINGYWTIEQVKVAVAKGKITIEEYNQITGENYIA